MFTLLSAILSGLSCRFRGRSFLELEVVALRHQVSVLRRQHTGRLRIGSWDRLLWVWLYRLWPQCLEVMVLVTSRESGAGCSTSPVSERPSALSTDAWIK